MLIMGMGLLAETDWEVGAHRREMHVLSQYEIIEPKTLWHPSSTIAYGPWLD